MRNSKIDKQKYIENHLGSVKEYFEKAEFYFKCAKKELKTVEQINNK